ncbi:hypothetical protein [Streptomyces sp. NPDC096324]|uniref:hypothetical protein n=1 Tax=Streptomyces sp. NPDC096324 TaxID=3366085 RepID=UPI0037F611BC
MSDQWSDLTVFRLFEDEDEHPDTGPGRASSSAAEPGPTPGGEDLQPGHVACRHCRATYDSGNPDENKLHTESVNCGQSCRCVGHPRCYTCRGSFCCCAEH